MNPKARERLTELLVDAPENPDTSVGYVNLLGDAAKADESRGIAQWLMRTSVVPKIYERYWRPALGKVAKGLGGPSMAEERRFAVERLALAPGQVVLDVACGPGNFTRAFAEVVGPDGLVVGLDASRTMLARAVDGTPETAPVAYLRTDAVRPPLREGSFDAACCFAALHLFAEPESALDSFARLLRPGGRVALLTSGRRPHPPLRTVDSVVGAASGMRMFDRGEVGNLLRARGFVDIVEQTPGSPS